MKDQHSDHNPRPLFFLDAEGLTPSFAKEASVAEGELSKLHRNAFAMPSLRLFPIHTPAETWKSAAYFYGSQYSDAAVESVILKAAAAHDVESAVKELKKVFTPNVKQASAPEYALQLTFNKEAAVQSFYPISNKEEIEESALAITKDASENRLCLELAYDACRALVKKARELEIPINSLPLRVQDLGVNHAPDVNIARSEINLRKEAAKDPLAVELYEDVYQGWVHELQSTDTPAEADKVTEKWATALIYLDSTQRLDKYSSTRPHPYKVLAGGYSEDQLQKLASEFFTIQDKLIPLAAIQDIPDGDIRRSYRKEAAESLLLGKKEAAEHQTRSLQTRVNALDTDEQDLLLTLALQYGE